MALGTNHESTTTLDVYIPEVWGERLNDFFKEELIMARFFIDRSDELMDGGDTLYTANITEMSSNAKTNGAQITLNNPTDTRQTLTVTTWREVSFLIEDREAAQIKKSYNLSKRYIQNAAFTVATDLEVAIATLFASFSQVVGASTTNVADSDIRQAIATLETNAVPGMWSGEAAFFFHPNVFWRQVQALDKFSLAVNSPVNDPTAKQPDAHLYGLPVYRTPNIQYVASTNGRNNALAHKDAIHWARLSLPATGKSSMVGSEGIRVQTNYIPEYLGFLSTADLCYGVVENRDNAGVLIRSHATFA